MRSTKHYGSRLLLRRSYQPGRVIRIRPTPRVKIIFRPTHRFGVKPRLEVVP